MDRNRIMDDLIQLIDYGENQGWSPPWGRVGRFAVEPASDPGRITMRTDDGTTFSIDVRIHEREHPSEGTGTGA